MTRSVPIAVIAALLLATDCFAAALHVAADDERRK